MLFANLQTVRHESPHTSVAPYHSFLLCHSRDPSADGGNPALTLSVPPNSAAPNGWFAQGKSLFPHTPTMATHDHQTQQSDQLQVSFGLQSTHQHQTIIFFHQYANETTHHLQPLLLP